MNKFIITLLMAFAAFNIEAKVTNVSGSEFPSAIEQGVAVADFYADWCGPCRKFAPVFEEVSNEMGGKASFIKVNVDQARDAMKSNNVSAIPTIIVYKNGKEVRRHVGPCDKSTLKKMIP